jgi:hypothetical protein
LRHQRSGVESPTAIRPSAGESAPGAQQTWEGDKANPTTRQIMDADSTTILVGREGLPIPHPYRAGGVSGGKAVGTEGGVLLPKQLQSV